MNAVDTNVFVYALDADEPVKQAKAQDLLWTAGPCKRHNHFALAGGR